MRIYLIIYLLFFYSTLSFGEPASVDSKPTEVSSEFDTAINLAGVSYFYNNNQLAVTIDMNKALKTIPAMQQAGVVNPRLSESDIKLLPATLSVTLVGMYYSAGIIQHLFDATKDLKQLHVTGNLQATDQYGNSEKIICYEFDFNRMLYEKINWDNFVPANLISITPNFQFSSACKTVLAAETGEPTA